MISNHDFTTAFLYVILLTYQIQSSFGCFFTKNSWKTLSNNKDFLISSVCNTHSCMKEKMSSKSISKLSAISLEWEDVNLWNELPSSLCKHQSNRPRLAKNEDYAEAILKCWMDDNMQQSQEHPPLVESSALIYECDDVLDNSKTDQSNKIRTKLYGHVYRPKQTNEMNKKIPAIILFHTAAGPHDIFLHWKAYRLASSNTGFIVFIADMFSDDIGWAWDDDRSKYNAVRDHLLQIHPNEKTRCSLRTRIEASFIHLQNVIPNIDTNRIGAIGWCFGGHIALELINMKSNVFGLKALATFHGVFHGACSMLDEANGTNVQESIESVDKDNLPQLLIFNGEKDPFISLDDKLAAQKLMSNHLWKWIDYKNCYHGFSNPAQATNSNPNFDYNEDAAKKSWDSVCQFLNKNLRTD